MTVADLQTHAWDRDKKERRFLLGTEQYGYDFVQIWFAVIGSDSYKKAASLSGDWLIGESLPMAREDLRPGTG